METNLDLRVLVTRPDGYWRGSLRQFWAVNPHLAAHEIDCIHDRIGDGTMVGITDRTGQTVHVLLEEAPE